MFSKYDLIITIVLAGLSAFLGLANVQKNKKLKCAASLISEIVTAVADKQVSQSEMERILASWRDFIDNIQGKEK